MKTTQLQSSTEGRTYEHISIRCWEKKEIRKLSAEDMLDFCNSINEYLLNYKDIEVMIEKVSIKPDKKNKLMTRVIVDFAIFAISRAKKEYNYGNNNAAHTWTSYRAIDHSCSNRQIVERKIKGAN